MNIIPYLLDKDTNIVTRSLDADMMLINITDKHIGNVLGEKDNNYVVTGDQYQWVLLQGQAIWCYVTRIGELYCFYACLKYCDFFRLKACNRIGAYMVNNYYRILATSEHTHYDDMIDEYRKYYKNNNYLTKFNYKYKLNKDIQKISQYHHFHVRLKDLFKNSSEVTLKGEEAYLALELDRFSTLATTHITFITYYRALPKKERELFMSMIKYYGGIKTEWLKSEGQKAKQMQGSVNYDMNMLFELNVLVNRIDSQVDWEEEQEHRENPITTDHNEGEIYNACKHLFEQARCEGKRPLKMSWEDYWQQRTVSMPSGAVHSQYESEKMLIKQLPHQIRSKKGLSSMLPDLQQQYFTRSKAEIHSYVSTKYEWGKVRALYGCDYHSHVNADFGLMACEETFPSYIPTGSKATEENVKYILSGSRHMIPFCYDYDDFNSQHTSSSMKTVIRAWIDVYKEQITDEQLQSALWTMNSIDNMTVHGIDNTYRAKGTLFSGWRLTTFINTALNFAYLYNAGLAKMNVKSIHNGDDVYVGMRNISDCCKIVKNAESRGVRANMSKMNIGTIAEFLRVDMRAKKTTGAQYLTRGIATFVHSRVESEAPLSLRSVITSYKTRYDEVLARGGNSQSIKPLYRKQLFFARKLFNASKDIIDKILTTDIIAGGVVKKGKISNYRLEDISCSENEVDMDVIRSKIKNGVTAYMTFLCRGFPLLKNEFSYNKVFKGILRSFNVYKSTVQIVDADRREIENEKALTGAWSSITGIALMNRVRLGVTNVVIAVSQLGPEYSAVLSRSNDPIKWLQVLT